jgi:hypothetical protein
MKFRSFCYEMWYTHCDEVEAYTGSRPDYKAKDYFSKYKWFLKREYKFQLKNGK